MGTPIYVAPEIIEGKEYQGELVDVFSCGVVLFIMLTGRYPFYCATVEDKRYKLLMDRNTSDYWKTFDGKVSISTEAMNLLEKMFAYVPAERITLEDIQLDPWFNIYSSQGGDRNQTMSKELDDKQKAIKSEVNRGPGPSPDQYREYLIEILPV